MEAASLAVSQCPTVGRVSNHLREIHNASSDTIPEVAEALLGEGAKDPFESRLLQFSLRQLTLGAVSLEISILHWSSTGRIKVLTTTTCLHSRTDNKPSQ